MPDQIENPDSPTPEDDSLESLDPNLAPSPDDADIEAVRAHNKSILEQNKKLFARAKSAEEKAKKLRETPPTPPAPSPDIPPTTPQGGSGDELTEVLSLQERGFSNGEILSLREKSKLYKIPLATFLKDETVLAGIEAQRAKRKADAATPPSSPRGTPLKPAKPFSKMTPDEKQAHFEEIRKRHTK